MRLRCCVCVCLRESREVPCGRMAFRERAPPSVPPAHIHRANVPHCSAAVPLLAQARVAGRAALVSSRQIAWVVLYVCWLWRRCSHVGMGLCWVATGRVPVHTRSVRCIAIVGLSASQRACLPAAGVLFACAQWWQQVCTCCMLVAHWGPTSCLAGWQVLYSRGSLQGQRWWDVWHVCAPQHLLATLGPASKGFRFGSEGPGDASWGVSVLSGKTVKMLCGLISTEAVGLPVPAGPL